MIECPGCGNELPDILSWDSWGKGRAHCSVCGRSFTKTKLKSMATADDCFECREGGLERETFNPEYVCDGCVRTDCILAGSSIYEDFGYVQDEEGNYCYPGDLD